MGDKDIGSKYLIDQDPQGWVRWLLNDFTLKVTEILSTDFQFVARYGDSLLKVEGAAKPFGVLAELQLQYKKEMPARLQNYCAMARQKYQIPIVPIVIYLTPPGANEKIATAYHGEFMGLVTHQDFKVVKMWELDAKEMLAQTLPANLLPFIPLMQGGATESVVRECVRRIRLESDSGELETILALFAMIKMDTALVERIMRWNMTLLEKSPLYRHILEVGLSEGHAEGHAEGLAEGLADGLEEGLTIAIMRVLKRRFGTETAVIQPRLSQLQTAALEKLLDEALIAPDLATFNHSLTSIITETAKKP